MRLVKRLTALMGVDRAVMYTVIWRSWMALAAPINLLLVTRFLSPVAQGFFYTFGSVLALQVLFELGLTQLITQFASHERSHLSWRTDGTLEGDGRAKSRLASLLRSALTWYGLSSALVIILLLTIGFWLFGLRSAADTGVSWKVPWTLFVVFAGISFAFQPALAVLEGCGLVAEVALMRVGQIITSSAAMWLVLWRGGELLALVAVKGAEMVWILSWMAFRNRAVLLDLVKTRPGARAIHWRQEVWPVQWRTALTWASSILILPVFNPLLFAFKGPAAAGRMGLSISMVVTINTIGLAWITTRAPTFGALIARRDFRGLDGVFFPALVKSTVVVIAAGVAVIVGTVYLHHINHPWSQRILDPLPMALLVSTTVVLHLIYSQAAYLRAHKAEPLVAAAVGAGLATGAASYLLVGPFGATGICLGFLTCMLVYLHLTHRIFNQKRREWHTDPAAERSGVSS